jgi:hypothetical protein
MQPDIYFEKSGERVGPFPLPVVIEKLFIQEFSLMDSVYCENISNIWTTLHNIFIKLFPDEWSSNIYVSPGNGKTSGPFTIDDCLIKANSDEGFWNGFLLYNHEAKQWQSFKKFLTEFLLLKSTNDENCEEGDVDENYVNKTGFTDTNEKDAPSEIKVLDRMIAESSEFNQLSSSLSAFNLWDFFKINTSESQNERMLLWLLKENKSHNLGDFFLRRWLILILHNDFNLELNNQRSLNPLNIEYARVVESKIISQKRINVNGKTRILDLFLDLKTLRQEDWVIIIEIKVDSFDHKDQLKDYRQWLNEHYPKHKKLTVFLYDENCPQSLPEDEEPHWLKTTFSDIRKVLKEALIEKKGIVPLREKSFIEQYLENLPPLAPEGKSENLDELTHALFGHYSSGIKYAIMANNQKIENLSSWQLHARYFVQERKKEFFLLAKQNETNFLKKQLSHDLSCGSWFPNTTQLPDLIVFNPNDYGIDLVSLMVDNDSKWSDSISINHLSVYIHLFHGTYQGHSRFRLRIRVPEQNGFEEKRNDLINDFFGQINPSNYGGNHVTNKSSGLIYNKVLNYESSENLFTLSHSIVKSLYEIWCEDDNFLMAINAILEHVRD